MDLFLINTAQILYLCSYLMRDILWLRVLVVVGIIFMVPYYYMRSEPLIAAILWDLVFLSINAVQIIIILFERRQTRLSPDEQQLHQLVFRNLTPKEMLRLLKLAHWTEFSEGEMILTRGESVDKLILIFIGEMAVEIEGKNIANLHSGSWVGEMSFINNEKASADVRVVKMAKCVYWDRKDINRFLKNNDQLRSAFYHILGVDIVKKIATISERQRDWKGG